MFWTQAKSKNELGAHKKEICLVGAIIVVAFAFRVVLIYLKEGYLGHDYAVYLMIGRNLALGRGFTINGLPHLHHPPLFPIMIAAIYYFTNNLMLSGNIVSVALGTLALIPLYLLGTEIYGVRTGNRFVLMCCFAPALTSAVLFWGSMTEPIFLFFAYLGLFISLLALRRDDTIWYVMLAIAFALAYLVRAEGILYLVLVLLAIAFIRMWERSFNRLDLAKLLLSLFVFVVFASPYLAYLHKYTGKWMISGKTSITYILYPLAISDPVTYEKKAYSLDRDGTALMIDSYRTISPFSAIKKDPNELITRALKNWSPFLHNLFSLQVFPWFLLPFSLVGVTRSLRAKKMGKEIFFLSFAVIPALSFLFFHVEARFLVIVVPILFLWTAKGLVEIETWLQKIGGSKTASNIIIHVPYVLIILSLLAISVRIPLSVKESAQHEKLRRWLSASIPPNSVIMSREPELAVYADAEWAGTLPFTSYERFVKYARLKRTDYFVLNQQFTSRFRPQLDFLLKHKDLPPEVKVVYSDNSADKTVVYKLRKDS